VGSSLTTSANSPAVAIENVAVGALSPRIGLSSQSHVAELLATVRVATAHNVVSSAHNSQANHA
jgi:hypothetical protein